VTPGDVIGDMNRRRGAILEQVERAPTSRWATIPLLEMFGCIGQLRSMTSAGDSFTMEFSHCDRVPKNVADEVIAEVQKRKAAANA
jgi:elongation factor G